MPTLIAILVSAAALAALDRLAATDALVGTPFVALSWAAEAALFFLPFLVILLAVVVVLPTLRSRRLLAGLLVTATVTGALWFAPIAAPAASGPRGLRVVTLNVLSASGDFERLHRYLVAEDPDVVVLQEVVYDWAAAIERWPEFPHRYRIRGSDVEILSRLPLARGASFTAIGADAMRAVFAAPDGGELVVFGIHPPSPHRPSQWVARNVALEAIAARVAAEPADARVIVAGDYNTPSWSPRLRRFLAETGLSLAHEGVFPKVTRFLMQIGAPAFVGAPIDHVAVSRTLPVLHQTVGPPVGSDHLPVIVDLALPRPAAG